MIWIIFCEQVNKNTTYLLQEFNRKKLEILIATKIISYLKKIK